ncbi:MAG: hypothetical protein EBT34_06395, partial [Acetobacteraceae bacterium]|nr:hypothetical protein [Acetobacteraceae bacterium]
LLKSAPLRPRASATRSRKRSSFPSSKACRGGRSRPPGPVFSTSDTIVAIATPPGHGGIGVVRLSGPEATRIGGALTGRHEPLAPRVATFATVRVGPDPGITNDHVVLTYFMAPASYTGEDVVEISAHGSPVVLRGIVRAAIDAGARLAEPGEFTFRAFLHQKLDLIQAELEKSTNFRWWPHRPDDQVAADIAKDNLDLLFELGGSTAMNKLEVMAYRPARLGGSWLGYPHSAGLETIDYILVDPYIKPEDPRLLIEKPFELPETWVTVGGRLGFYEVPIDLEIPEDRRGYVTFGTANNPYKYTKLCIDTWAAVLRRVPNSRFIFIRPEAGGPSFLENTRAAFAARDVDPDRIEFVGIRGKHLPHYNKMDISLDTLPHVGGTTTCESIWMGVPCISLVGPGFAERLSYSNLSNAGIGDLATFSIEAYIEKAAELAADAPRRRVLRHGLRDMIRAMPLGQPARFGKAFYDKAAEVCAL